MAVRYTPQDLLQLRQSPLCTKPPNLPPPDEWMGPPPESFRNQTKPVNERSKTNDNPLLDQTNRRPTVDRHLSRNTANPEDIILGPPRMSFASATSMRSGGAKIAENDKGLRDSDSRDRLNFRNRATDVSETTTDRFRDGRNNFRRRGESDQDSEGWSTVKPRKSFGHEGAERFHGRMGGGGADRFGREDRRNRDRDDVDGPRDRPRRNFDQHAKDKDGEEPDGTRRNGLTRGRSEPWFKEGSVTEDRPDRPERPSQRERIDRAKSWRDRNPEEPSGDHHRGQQNERNNHGQGRWDRDRDHRNEREPEWLDEPPEDKATGRTEDDLKKWMETMKKGHGAQKRDEKGGAAGETSGTASFFELDAPKMESAPAVDPRPDRFFEQFAKSAGLEEATAANEANNESAKAKGGKSSKFMSLFKAQEDARRQTEPPTPAASQPPPLPPNNGLMNILAPQPSSADKEAFQALLQKLQRQTLQGGGTPTQAVGAQEPPAPRPQDSRPDARQKNAITSPEPPQYYGRERRDDPRFQAAHQNSLQDILSPRPMPPNQPPSARPEQLLHDLVGQRQLAASQGSSRPQQHISSQDDQTKFLMTLIQRHQNAPEARRTEELLVRMPQPQKQVSVPPLQERDFDAEFQRERAAQRQMRGQGPPGMFEDQYHRPEPDNRPPPQPTQILQRPPPPGLDHQMHPSFLHGGGQLPPPPQRPMIPPPGLAGSHSRPIPGMFPPNFPPGGFHPPEGMGGPPPRNMGPPPGFFNGPPPPGPPGFMPPPGMGFQGPPEGMPFPFDGRGMPPPGAGFRR